MTFGVLLLWLGGAETLFRTGWFVESVVSASVIVLSIRTKKPLTISKPGHLLLFSVLAIVTITCLFPFLPFAGVFGFAPLPPIFYIFLVGIVGFYIIAVEVAKHYFFHNHL
jgi:Mg2+-importing ATPase